ncbi:hypothetical protein EU520_00655 [Candidatus Thorarchaeota archaeon]|nr:MAG: hypothetical protein EU520_00655 [Candidatus Thorarchaeota archaeon]
MNWFLRKPHYQSRCVSCAMSKFELVKQTLLGNLGDRVPISIWKHHPELDRTPEGLAEEETAFHRTYNHDLLKISFHGRYPVVDWGCVAIYDGAPSGSTTCKSCIVQKASDWETLEPLDVNAGEFGDQVRAVELIHDYAQEVVPTMATVFDPAMVADKLCENDFIHYIETNPETMKGVLDMISNVMVDFGRATLDAGADGIFLASQHSTESAVTDRQYREFVLPYQKKLLTKLRGRAAFVVLHLHARDKGEKIRFSPIARAPGTIGVNWEDQTSATDLKAGKKLTRKTVLGGIDHKGWFRTGTTDEVEQEILGVLKSAGLRRLIVAPGCVVRVDTPEENIQTVVDTVRAINPWSKEWEEYT